MINYLGLIAAISFGLCAVPQAWKSWKEQQTYGMSPAFLTLWCIGEATMLTYVTLTSRDPYLLANYLCNGVCLVVIVAHAMWPTRSRRP